MPLVPLPAWHSWSRSSAAPSVADPERIREVADHVARCRRRGDDVVLVVSAMGKETDELLRLAGEVSHIRPGREMDMLITAGERKAIALVSMAWRPSGRVRELHGLPGRVLTDTNHTNAKILQVARRPHPARRSTPVACPWSPDPRGCPPNAT